MISLTIRWRCPVCGAEATTEPMPREHWRWRDNYVWACHGIYEAIDPPEVKEVRC